MICFACAMSTPEMEAITEQAFISQLRAAGPIIIIGSEAGPYPLSISNPS